MPEETIAAPPPTETSPATAPTPSPSPVRTGTASLMDDMDSMMGKPSESKPEDKPVAEKPKEAVKTAPPKDDSGKSVKPAEPPKIELVKEKDPVQLRKRLAEVESDLHKTRTEKETTVGELQRKMAELEKRPYLTEEQQKRYTALEERSKQLEAQLYARSYAESPEYKEKYQKRWQARYETAVRELSGLQVKTKDHETGEETVRPATQADFERVRGLRGSRVAQIHEAKRLFGEDYNIVIDDCRELDAIEQQAAEDVSTRRAKYDEEMAQRGQQSQQFGNTVQQSATATEASLREKYPDWFGKSDDPEIEAAMQKGLGFVDSTSEQADKLTPEERGQRVATIRILAGAFPRNVIRIQRQEAEISDLKAKLAKLQGTDPGEGGETGSDEKKSANVTAGTAGLMAEF